MNHKTKHKTLQAKLVCLPQMLSSSITLPQEMLFAASQLARLQRLDKRLEISLCGPEEFISTASGLGIHCSANLEAAKNSDLLILPALWGRPEKTLLKYAKTLKPVLKKLDKSKKIICAVGTSSCFLAEAGILDGKPATTHWHYLNTFAQKYPAIDVQKKHLITQAQHLYCASSINAVADLVVHFIEDMLGASIARSVEAQFSPEIRRDWEDYSLLQAHDDELILLAQDFLSSQLSSEISMQDVAGKLGISTRSLNRRFKKATSLTPVQYLQQQRIAASRELLRNSNLGIAEVSEQVGIQDSSYFCELFQRHMAQTPQEYRNRSRGKLFKPETGNPI